MTVRYTLLLVFLMQVACLPSFGSVTYYVSVKKGNDNNVGSSNKPFRTIEFAVSKAIDVINHRNEDVELRIAEGDYYLENELLIQTKRGKGKLMFKANKPGKVYFRGDKTVGTEIDKTSPIRRFALSGMDLGIAIGNDNRIDLYCNHKKQLLARWPNEGFLSISDAVGKTSYKDNIKKEPIIKYSESKINDFKSIRDVFVYGYWCYEWYDDYAKVKEIDTIHHTITLTTENYPWGFKKGGKYRFVNSLKDVDEPGEYYIDRNDSILYWFPIEGYTPNKDELTLSLFDKPRMVSLVDVDNVVFDGICFVGGRNDCLYIDQSNNVIIKDCKVSEFGGIGAKVTNSKCLRIDGCSFRELGGEGIHMVAGNLEKLESADATINNCIFEDLSNYRDTYRAAIRFKGCGAVISHNHFRNHPSSAIGIDGNNVIVEYNIFEDLVKESGDQGAIDMFMDYSFRGVVIRYNIWRNIYGKHINVAAIRLDDMISGEQVYGNIFENCGNTYFGAIQIHGGNHNRIHDNVFINCPSAVSFNKFAKEEFAKVIDKQKSGKALFITERYKAAYPELRKDELCDYDKNWISHNLMINVNEPYRREGETNVLSNNVVVSMDKVKLNTVIKSLPRYGIANIPYKKIGVKRSIYQ